MKRASLDFKPEYVIDRTGKRIKVILDISKFEDIVDKLEDLYFGLMAEKAMQEKDQFVSLEEMKKKFLV